MLILYAASGSCGGRFGICQNAWFPHFTQVEPPEPKPQDEHKCTAILANAPPHLMHSDPLLPKPQELHKTAWTLAKAPPHLTHSDPLLPKPQELQR